MFFRSLEIDTDLKSIQTLTIFNFFEAFNVVFSHQRGIYSWIRAFFTALLRTFTLFVMAGSMMIFKLNDRKIGVSAQFVKGNCLFVVWFYSDPKFKHKMVWYRAACSAIGYAIKWNEQNESKIDWVDLGPCRTEKGKENKARVGCLEYLDWRNKIQFEGPVRELDHDTLLKSLKTIFENKKER
jgi:hypothetical protein